MVEYTQITDDLIPEDYVPDWEALRTATKEHPFMEASFNLMAQAAQLAILIGNLQPKAPLKRNEAIIVGLIVRLTKLTKITLRDLSNHETFQQFSVARQFIETTATLEYLLADSGDGSRYDQYVQNSLIAEREVILEIAKNIGARGGKTEHIETRMKKSIADTAKAAGIDDVSKLPARKSIGFPSIEERVKLLSKTAYVAYRTSSSEVHGDWSDLYKHHLLIEGDSFLPNYDEPVPRPQTTTTLTSLLCMAMVDYLDVLEGYEAGVIHAFKTAMNDVEERITQVVELHEQYLKRSP